jgi:predicted site-specific integrase-resolvase
MVTSDKIPQKEVLKRFDISRTKLYWWRKMGLIKTYTDQAGKKLFFDPSEINSQFQVKEQ